VDIQNILLCDNRTLLDHFKQLLESNGIETTVINSELEGNASEVGEKFAEPIFRWIDGQNMIDPPFNVKHLDRSKTKRFAWLYGGETTVRFPANLPNSNPKGGRNQEMVLSVLNKLRQNLPSQQHPKRTFYFASFGTDGQDGPTDATGAIISNNHLYSSDNIMGQICDYLHYKDSYTFWSIFRNGECLVKINKTGNNLMDVQLLLFEDK
jgi:glycerate-2-kinase